MENNNNSNVEQVDDLALKSVHQLLAKDLSVSRITVYNDRAEVTKYVKAALKEKGLHELKIQGISTSVEMNSIRVSGATGEATILEVTPSTRFGVDVATSSAQFEELKKEETKLKEEIQIAQESLNRITKQTAWLEGWATNALGGQQKETEKDSVMCDFLSQNALQLATNFMDFYSNQLDKLNKDRRETNKIMKALQERLSTVELELRVLRAPPSTQVVDVCVALSCAKHTEIELELSYLIRNASWVASYDCRVNTSDNTIQLTYYGSITNSTGEDWNNAHMNLSTASPSAGGSPPDLKTMKVGYPRPVNPMLRSYQYEEEDDDDNEMIRSIPTQSAAFAKKERKETITSLPPPPPMAVLTATASENASSTTFSIQRKATIAADSKPHKVTIAILDNLKPRFSYTTVPSKSLTAYLKVTATNTTTQFPLLKGQINVFMDNNFVTTSSLQHVSPGEEFALFLGADSGIKVEYDPIKTFNEVQGTWSKVNVNRTTCRTIIKNNKKVGVAVCVIDQLPLSSDDKIKVKLIEPVISTSMKDDIKINKENNIEWRYVIPPKGTKEIPFEYEIEYPKDKSIEKYQN